MTIQGRGLLALWVTNRERHRRFVDAELLPAWGLRHVATWYWLKVTNDAQLVSSLVCCPAPASMFRCLQCIKHCSFFLRRRDASRFKREFLAGHCIQKAI